MKKHRYDCIFRYKRSLYTSNFTINLDKLKSAKFISALHDWSANMTTTNVTTITEE